MPQWTPIDKEIRDLLARRGLVTPDMLTGFVPEEREGALVDFYERHEGDPSLAMRGTTLIALVQEVDPLVSGAPMGDPPPAKAASVTAPVESGPEPPEGTAAPPPTPRSAPRPTPEPPSKPAPPERRSAPKSRRLVLVALTLVCGLACLATSVFLAFEIAASTGAPAVTITSPKSGRSVRVGSQVEIVANVSSPVGLREVVVEVSGDVIDTFSGTPAVARWTPSREGTYLIRVTAIDRRGASSYARVVVSAISAGGSSFKGTSPKAVDFWTVMVDSRESRTEALDVAARVRARGFNAGVLWSSDYPSLRPGWWATYSGRYGSLAEARRGANALEATYPEGDNYPRRVTR